MRSTDPRIVALYDLDNPSGDDHDYYRSLAQRPESSPLIVVEALRPDGAPGP